MPPRSPDPPALTGALLERSRELSTLGAFLDDAKEVSHGRFVFLAGEAGIGKTSLLREVCADCGRGTRVLWGGCDPMVTPQPLAVMIIASTSPLCTEGHQASISARMSSRPSS